MKLKKMLNKALEKQIKANAIVKGVLEVVGDDLIDTIHRKYANTKIINREENLLSFEDVRVPVNNYEPSEKILQVDILFTAEEIPEEEQEAVREIMRSFDENRYIKTRKGPFWEICSYELSFDEILSKKFNLNFET